MDERLDNVIAKWTRLGVGFGGAPSSESPDLERVVLETARCAPAMARLFIMATTWLHRYGELIAKHRLRRLVRDELEPAHHATLGLMLDAAQRDTHPPRFASIIRDLTPASEPRPLFEVERASEALAARAEVRASALSAAWGVWCEAFEFKDDALRPANWVMRMNPGLVARADFRGDLRASVLASLTHDAGAGRSELELARRCGGSRAQVRHALDNLELTGKASRRRSESDRRTSILIA